MAWLQFQKEELKFPKRSSWLVSKYFKIRNFSSQKLKIGQRDLANSQFPSYKTNRPDLYRNWGPDKKFLSHNIEIISFLTSKEEATNT